MQAVITYDLNALAHNLALLREVVGAGNNPENNFCEVQPVIKSCAYGLTSGSSNPELSLGLSMPRLIDSLATLDCRRFYVAHWQEAAEYICSNTRSALELEFFALNGITDSEDAGGCVEYGITPVINSLPSLRIWQSETQEATSDSDQPPPYALHVDTGMNRLGLSADEFQTFVASITDRENPLSKLPLPSWIISHLSCADDQTSHYNGEQLTRFCGHCAALVGAAVKTNFNTNFKTRPFKMSIANSAGCFLANGYHFDAVRVGAALYGLQPVSRAVTGNNLTQIATKLRLVVRVTAPIIQLRAIDAGATVGYAQGWIARRKTIVATVAFGYGDGYPCGHLGSKNKNSAEEEDSMMALYEGKYLRVLGRVSMDLLALDFTEVAAESSDLQRHLGGMVTLLGEETPAAETPASETPSGASISCEHLATRAGDLNYRVLANMTSSRRAKHEVIPLSIALNN